MHRVITNKNLLHINLPRRILLGTRSFSLSKPICQETNKIYALPFKLSPEKAPQVVDLANYITEHKVLGLFRLLKSMLFKSLPQVSNPSDIQIKKAYLPFWYYDMAIKATVTRQGDDTARDILSVGLNNYWTGHTWDPMCYLSLGFPISIDKSSLVPFSTIDDQDDIEMIPFSTDPFQDLGQHLSALEGFELRDMTINRAELAFGAAYPMYFPVYIAQVGEAVMVVGGHSENPSIFKYTPNTKQKWLNNGEWIRLDVSDPTWRVGLPVSPLQELCKTFVDKVVNRPALATNPRQPIEWDDVRIQAYPTSQQENKDYIEQLYKVWAQQSMIGKLEGMDSNQRTVGMGKNGIEMKSAEQFKQEILDSIGDDLQKLEQVEPHWLKLYNQQLIQENKKDENVDH